MTFFDVITRGLTRRPMRTGLTLVGISVGIGSRRLDRIIKGLGH